MVPLFFHQDQILYAERLRVRQAKGLMGEVALRATAEHVLHGRPIHKALNITSWCWEAQAVPTGRSDHAWSWIHAHQKHGPAIRAAEADIDRIGAKGDPKQLQRACDAWVDAWREAIEDWSATGKEMPS